MKTSQQWSHVLVVFLLFVGTACGSKGDVSEGGGGADEVTPNTITVTISSEGRFSPDPLTPNPGDKVVFVADGDDMVLCVDPSTLFGEGRYKIANGTSQELTVQADAIHIDFGYIAITGDLMAGCGGEGVRGGEGGGKTGP